MSSIRRLLAWLLIGAVFFGLVMGLHNWLGYQPWG